jgi:hypothetical protein
MMTANAPSSASQEKNQAKMHRSFPCKRFTQDWNWLIFFQQAFFHYSAF